MHRAACMGDAKGFGIMAPSRPFQSLEDRNLGGEFEDGTHCEQGSCSMISQASPRNSAPSELNENIFVCAS